MCTRDRSRGQRCLLSVEPRRLRSLDRGVYRRGLRRAECVVPSARCSWSNVAVVPVRWEVGPVRPRFPVRTQIPGLDHAGRGHRFALRARCSANCMVEVSAPPRHVSIRSMINATFMASWVPRYRCLPCVNGFPGCPDERGGGGGGPCGRSWRQRASTIGGRIRSDHSTGRNGRENATAPIRRRARSVLNSATRPGP